jgi:hypothetical protein
LATGVLFADVMAGVLLQDQHAHAALQVGSVNNTFGIKGVQEHCQFFKSIENASSLRRRISECFERAALPYVSLRVQPCASSW